jgi:transcription initiation factor TFIID subunit 6
MPSDIDEALKVLNIEPLYGHSSFPPPAFRRAPGQTPVYFVEDEEIDFDRVVREEKVFLPKPVSYTAHWLAVEGVQPLIPENPPAVPKPTPEGGRTSPKPGTTNGVPPTPPSPTRTSGLANTLKTNIPGKQTLVKQVLSRELQLYYARLTASLLPATIDDAKRTAALASLRHDAGLQPLLPYLVRWVAEGVVATLKVESPTESDGQQLEVLIEVLSALLGNQSLFVEPYVCRLISLSDCVLPFL